MTYAPNSGFTGQDSIGVNYVDATDNTQSSQTVPVAVQTPTSEFAIYNPQVDGGPDGYYVLESRGVVTVTVFRTGDIDDEATVACSTVDGSGSSGAVSGTNFTAITDQTLTFLPHHSSANISISLVTNAALYGNEEYFYLSLGTPSGDNTINTTLTSATIYLLEDPHQPLAQDYNYQTTANQSLHAGAGTGQPSLLAGDFDLAGDMLTLTQINGSTVTPGDTITLTSGATVVADNAGDFVYTPPSSFTGTDSFEYTVANGSASMIGVANIIVNPPGPQIFLAGGETVRPDRFGKHGKKCASQRHHRGGSRCLGRVAGHLGSKLGHDHRRKRRQCHRNRQRHQLCHLGGHGDRARYLFRRTGTLSYTAAEGDITDTTMLATVEDLDNTLTDNNDETITCEPTDGEPGAVSVSVPGPLSTPMSSSLPITGISIADTNSDSLTVIFEVSYGTLTLASVSGGTISGNGTDEVSVDGSLAAVNANLVGGRRPGVQCAWQRHPGYADSDCRGQ